MATSSAHAALESEVQKVKIAVLGAQEVGKSSLVQQFVCNVFSEEYHPTVNKVCYYPSVIINEHLYEVKIIDCPMIPYFPVNSMYEWSDFRDYGLRHATAYILVFDMWNDESFQYIRNLREQILESRSNSGQHDVPIMVVGNKHDLGQDRLNLAKRETATVVRKQWKCGYVECSAKYNWHVVAMFKEVMKAIDCMNHSHKPTAARMQDALRRNKCVIL